MGEIGEVQKNNKTLTKHNTLIRRKFGESLV